MTCGPEKCREQKLRLTRSHNTSAESASAKNFPPVFSPRSSTLLKKGVEKHGMSWKFPVPRSVRDSRERVNQRAKLASVRAQPQGLIRGTKGGYASDTF